jgi:hypothetical protein
LKVVKQITAQYGEDALGDLKRLKSFFGDLAKGANTMGYAVYNTNAMDERRQGDGL